MVLLVSDQEKRYVMTGFDTVSIRYKQELIAMRARWRARASTDQGDLW